MVRGMIRLKEFMGFGVVRISCVVELDVMESVVELGI